MQQRPKHITWPENGSRSIQDNVYFWHKTEVAPASRDFRPIKCGCESALLEGRFYLSQ
jgi:hypothetical protein